MGRLGGLLAITRAFGDLSLKKNMGLHIHVPNPLWKHTLMMNGSICKLYRKGEGGVSYIHNSFDFKPRTATFKVCFVGPERNFKSLISSGNQLYVC